MTPTSGSVLLGSSQTLTATVTNATNTSVTWSVNGVAGGSASSGTITTSGVYTAPGDLPSSPIVQVTATSQADSTKSATAQLAVMSDIGIDVSVAGNLSVQIQNPGGTASNAVSLVVTPPNTSNDVIALSNASPNAAGKDIVVVDPTTAGVSAQSNDVDLNVAALGMFSVASNSCSLSGNPLRSLGRRAGARHSISARSPKADWTPA